MDYSWPGNVRELKKAVEHAFVTVNGHSITVFDLQPEVRTPNPDSLKKISASAGNGKDDGEKGLILQALRQSAGHRGRAAKSLGMSRVTLWKKMNHYGIEV